MPTYEPKPWRKGKDYGAVVSDELAPGSLAGAENREAYGGYLVAESIAAVNTPIIAAAPEMLALLREFVDALRADPTVTLNETRKLIARIDADVAQALRAPR